MHESCVTPVCSLVFKSKSYIIATAESSLAEETPEETFLSKPGPQSLTPLCMLWWDKKVQQEVWEQLRAELDTSSNLLAQMLQLEYDREHDRQLLSEEKHFNKHNTGA